jgi:hypothetical protein
MNIWGRRCLLLFRKPLFFWPAFPEDFELLSSSPAVAARWMREAREGREVREGRRVVKEGHDSMVLPNCWKVCTLGLVVSATMLWPRQDGRDI